VPVPITPVERHVALVRRTTRLRASSYAIDALSIAGGWVPVDALHRLPVQSVVLPGAGTPPVKNRALPKNVTR